MKMPVRFRKQKKAKIVARKTTAAKGRPTRLKATAKAASRKAMDDYEDEPTMKLGTAVIVVLVLHVVAVGGVYAFNSIKAERMARQERAQEFASEPVPTRTALESSRTVARSLSMGEVHRVEAGETLAGIARNYGVTLSELEDANELRGVTLLRVGQELRIPEVATPASGPTTSKTSSAPVAKSPTKVPAPASAPVSAPAKDSGQTYTVVKGDNPVAIARKFEVSYNDLMKINNIEDPRLLQIGQKLKIPTRE
jgi:LysM repeat protein